MSASVFRSWTWFRADEPQARKNTPATGTSIAMDSLCDARIYPVKAEQAARAAIPDLQMVRFGLMNRIVLGA
jgi:hypothetical protein